MLLQHNISYAISCSGVRLVIYFCKKLSDVPLSLNTILQKAIINFLKSQAADLFAN